MTLRDDVHELREAWHETTGYSAPGNVGGGGLYALVVLFIGVAAVFMGAWLALLFL